MITSDSSIDKTASHLLHTSLSQIQSLAKEKRQTLIQAADQLFLYIQNTETHIVTCRITLAVIVYELVERNVGMNRYDANDFWFKYFPELNKTKNRVKALSSLRTIAEFLRSLQQNHMLETMYHNTRTLSESLLLQIARWYRKSTDSDDVLMKVLEYAYYGDHQSNKEGKQPCVKDVQLYLTYLTTSHSAKTIRDSANDDDNDNTDDDSTHTISFTSTSTPRTSTPQSTPSPSPSTSTLPLPASTLPASTSTLPSSSPSIMLPSVLSTALTSSIPIDNNLQTRVTRLQNTTTTNKDIAVYTNHNHRQDEKQNNNKRKHTDIKMQQTTPMSTRDIVIDEMEPQHRPTTKKKKKKQELSTDESKHEMIQTVAISTPPSPTIPTNMEGMNECIICTDPFHPNDALISICGDRRHIVHFVCWKTNVRLNRKIGRRCFCRQKSAAIPVDLYWNNTNSCTSIETNEMNQTNENKSTNRAKKQQLLTVEPHLKWAFDIPPEDKSGDIIKTLRRCQQNMPKQFNSFFQQLSHHIQGSNRTDDYHTNTNTNLKSAVFDIRRLEYSTEANVLRLRL